jgi:hypothetical protein
MNAQVSLDDLLEALLRADAVNPAPDGRWTLHPVRRSLTLTNSKHVIVAAEDWDAWELRWESVDVLLLRVGSATFRFEREQITEILDVNLPEQPLYRTVTVELVAELTIDFTVEYEEREPDG